LITCEGVETTKKKVEVLEPSFHMSNLESWSPKKYEVKGLNMYNSNQFIASQNLLYNFFKGISNVIFSPRYILYLRLIPIALNQLRKFKIAIDTLI